MSNQQVVKILRNVAAAYTIKDEKKFLFQIIAYQKAADAIENLNQEITELVKTGGLETIPGVGPSIKQHLEELVIKGSVKHFKWVFKDIPQSVFVLTDIPTFGPKKAYKLVETFRLKNEKTVVDDIEKLAKKGKISILPGFGQKSESEVLKVINDFKKGRVRKMRMVLPFAFQLSEKILNYLRKSKAVLRAEPLGSLRRMKPTVGDIDIAVESEKPKEVLSHFTSYPYKEKVIEKGEITASITVSGGHQVDVMVQPPKSFGSLLQHFTGSKNHNIHLREFALKKGLSLSEYGIKKVGRKEQIQTYETEESFYEAVGLKWIPPEIREDTGEIERAATGNLPDLVETSDIKGDLHIHSSFPIEPSHDLGRNSMEEIIAKAEKLNYEYLGFSEHNPSLSKHSDKEVEKILLKRDKAIEQIKSCTKSVRVFKLLEVDIPPNGNLPLKQEHLDILDAVIVSIHSAFGQEKNKVTERILKALSNKKAKILGHPTGRLLNYREPINADWDLIFSYCKKNKKALEINSFPNRLDLPDSLIRKAVDENMQLVINTDSHAAYQMDMIKYGVSMARRGWAEKRNILNTNPYEDVKKWLLNQP